MKKTILLLRPFIAFWLLAVSSGLLAAPQNITYHIKIDQFGYLPNAKKVAVIADPQIGFNTDETFNASTGINQYQVRRWSDDSVLYSGTLQVWNGGATQPQSGDRGWWFDFSSVKQPGTYYIYDVANNVGSFAFSISDHAYDEVLRQASRMFFYQRINYSKQLPFADARWSDAACFEGPNQDRYATSRWAKGDMTTTRDVSGGWMDAGDKNKYTTFALAPVVQLAEAYRINPTVFKDNNNIPESGNGIPDILDELRWELDWLKRMQDASGTNGFFLKVGVDNNNEVSPPSADSRSRYYLPECTSSSIAGCAAFAAAGVTFKGVPQLSDYGVDLISRAQKAWERVKITTNNFTSFQTDCDDGNIKAGDADNNAERQLDNAVVAAIYLYEATGNAEYKTFAESNYTKVHVYAINWWGPYWMPQQLALLRLTKLPGVSATVVTNIRNQKAAMDYQNSVNSYKAATDLYRAQMDDASYTWGHNQARAGAGTANLDYVTFGINTDRSTLYKETAEQYLHWMHGVNPMGMVMLSNMYEYGAEKCVNEIFHTWFKNGTEWDNALTSSKGPAPGYVPGGPNKQYSGTVSGIATQPHQKAYKDWNTDWPENSWEITEPAIYYQAAYIALLSRLMYDVPAVTVTDSIPPSAPLYLLNGSVGQTTVDLRWNAATDNVGVTGYDVFQDTLLIAANVKDTSKTISGLVCSAVYHFSVKAKDASGNISAPSNSLSVSTARCTSIVSKMLYDDVLQADWLDTSVSCSRTYNSTGTVKDGTYALKAAFASYGTLGFMRSIAVSTTATTQLRFWVYNTGRYSIRVYTESETGVKSTEVQYKPSKGRWEEVVIGLSQLGNPSSIKKVVIQNNSSSAVTLNFDLIQLTDVIVNTVSALQKQTSYSSVAPGVNMESVYPNPAQDVVHLRVTAANSGAAFVHLNDNNGRTLWQKTYAVNAGSNLIRVETGYLKSGVYYIHYHLGSLHKVEKLLIAR